MQELTQTKSTFFVLQIAHKHEMPYIDVCKELLDHSLQVFGSALNDNIEPETAWEALVLHLKYFYGRGLEQGAHPQAEKFLKNHPIPEEYTCKTYT